MIVLAGAALLVRSAIKLQQEPIGFDTRGVLTARLALPAAQYGSPARARNAFAGPRSRAGIARRELAALDSQPPLVGGGGSNGLFVEGTADRRSDPKRLALRHARLLPVIRNPLKAGRIFTDGRRPRRRRS